MTTSIGSLLPEIGYRGKIHARGSVQYPLIPMARNRGVITNTNALQAPGIRASIAGLATPEEASDLSAAGARFVLGPLDPTLNVGLEFVLGRTDGGDVNNRMAQFRIRAYRELRKDNRRQWVARTLMDGYLIAGNSAVHDGSLLLPKGPDDSTNPSGYTAKWVDTIGITNDYTLGQSTDIVHDAADDCSMLVFDLEGHALIEIELTCLTDGVHGTAATFACGCYTQL